MNPFILSDQPLDLLDLANQVQDPRAGAVVTFEGRVRNENEGREVLSLEYEAYEALATREAEKIIAEASASEGVFSILCAHRIGRLDVGDLAVWVAVSSAHRSEAFQACRHVIDEIKTRVPIWKKEHYVDGDSEWVACEHCSQKSNPTRERIL